MKIKIEEYRGWEISFDTEKETFYAVSEEFDKDEKKSSFASVKKFIDEFIKENQVFKPFDVESTARSYVRNENIKIIGIRKDGRFFYELPDGSKSQLSEHNEKDYIVPDKSTDDVYKKIDEIERKKQVLISEIEELEKSITGKSLVEIKKELLAKFA